MLVTRECGSNQVWSCFQCVHSWPFCVRVSSEGDLWQSNQSLCSVSLAPELVKAWVCQHLFGDPQDYFLHTWTLWLTSNLRSRFQSWELYNLKQSPGGNPSWIFSEVCWVKDSFNSSSHCLRFARACSPPEACILCFRQALCTVPALEHPPNSA